MKMVWAILRKEDEETTTHALNDNGFLVTKLATTGAFLRKKNVTLLIGTEDEKVEKVIELLRSHAGKRSKVIYAPPSVAPGLVYAGANSMVPINETIGGATVFVMDVDRYCKI